MNVGDELDHIQEVFRLRDLPWRSFYCGHNYKLADEIGVTAYPTYIVIDRDQTIRSIFHSIDHRALDELLSPQ